MKFIYTQRYAMNVDRISFLGYTHANPDCPYEVRFNDNTSIYMTEPTFIKVLKQLKIRYTKQSDIIVFTDYPK